MILNSILSSPIKSIAFSKCDGRLGVGLESGILTLLCPESNWESVGEIDQSESCVSCQDWSSQTLACGRMNGSVTLFTTEKVMGNFLVPVAEFISDHPIRSLNFGTAGSFLAVGGENGVVSILNAKSDWALFNQINLGYSILSIKWSPAGRYMALAGSERVFSVYDTINWATVKDAKELVSSIDKDNESPILSLDWSKDSKWMVIGGFRSGIQILDTFRWKLLELPGNVYATPSEKLNVD